MNTLSVENVMFEQKNNGVVLSFDLCNKSDNIYYIEKRFLPDAMSDAITGFKIIQGNPVEYTGKMIKSKQSTYPEDYFALDVSKCKQLKINLSKYFVFNPQKEADISWTIFNANPINKTLDDFSFAFDYRPKAQ